MAQRRRHHCIPAELSRTAAAPPGSLSKRVWLYAAAALCAATASLHAQERASPEVPGAALPPLSAPVEVAPTFVVPKVAPPGGEPSAVQAAMAAVCGPAAEGTRADALIPHVATCQRVPEWLAQLGALLNREGRYDEAAEHLERSLMLAPDDLQAGLDYAVALAGVGDLLSATQLLGQWLGRPDLPDPLRASLAQAQQRYAAAGRAGTGWQWRRHAGLRLGRDSNLAGAPSITSLTLTLPTGNITLPIEEASLPRPGVYTRADVRMDLARQWSDGQRVEVVAALLGRSSPAAPETATTQAELAGEYSRPAGTFGAADSATMLHHYSGAAVASLHTRGGTRYTSLHLATGLQLQAKYSPPNGGGLAAPPGLSTCNTRVGAEVQVRNLYSNPVLSGRYAGLALLWSCNAHPLQVLADSAGISLSQWQFGLRAGIDSPTDATRPGGRQQQYSLRTAAHLGPRWYVDAELSHNRDTTAYSPILDNGRVRNTTRVSMRAEYQHPLPILAPGALAVFGIEGFRQTANLPLFAIRSSGPYIAIRGQW